MAYDGWIEFGDTEIVNISRTVQLAESLGIDTVWTTPTSVAWVEEALGGDDYDVPSNAPWYDPMYPASGEFAGVIPLSVVGLDDSTLESTPFEYVGDGGNTGIPRNKTLPVVASVALVASTDRGAEYGLRWLNRMLRGEGAGYKRMFCSGFDLTYFRFSTEGQSGHTALKAHRRNVRLTRGTSVTRKRRNNCSTTWLVTFTWTAADPYEYSDPTPVLSDFGSPDDLMLEGGLTNLAYNPKAVSYGIQHEFLVRGGWTKTFLTGLSTIPDLPNVSTSARFTNPSVLTAVTGEGVNLYQNPDTAPGTSATAIARPVTPGQTVTTVLHIRSSVLSSWVIRLRLHDGAGNWISGATVIGPSVLAPAGDWVRVETSILVPANATTPHLAAAVYNTTPTTFPAGATMDLTGIMVLEGDAAIEANVLPSGSITLIQQSCPKFDYSPIYDPQYPALVAPPTSPDFYPAGWNIDSGMTFDRAWVLLPPTAPGLLNVVPILTLSTATDARMVRVSVWDWNGALDRLCDPIWSAVITYLPATDRFVIDGEQRACYVWDGQSPEVRRSDSLVFSEDAAPVEWASFSTADSLLVTLDTFSESGEIEGDGTIRASLSWVQKSD